MARSLDYSKWDNVGDGSSSDEDGDRVIRKKAWEPIEKLKLIADAQFAEAEKEQVTTLYRQSLQLYDELIPKIEELQKVDPDRISKGFHLIVSCHLNACCCYIRGKRWSEANERCDIVLFTANSKSKKCSLTPVEEMQARYFRIVTAIPILDQNHEAFSAYQKAGVSNIRDPEAEKCFEHLEEDGVALSQLIVTHEVSEEKIAQYTVALEQGMAALEKYGTEEEADDDDERVHIKLNMGQKLGRGEEIDFDFSHTAPLVKASDLATQRDQVLVAAAESFRNGRSQRAADEYEDARVLCGKIRELLRSQSAAASAATDVDGAENCAREIANNEVVAGIAAAGKGTSLVKGGQAQGEEKVHSAVPLLEEAVQTLVGLTCITETAGDIKAARRHLYTAMDSLSEAHCLLQQWDSALHASNEALGTYAHDLKAMSSVNSHGDVCGDEEIWRKDLLRRTASMKLSKGHILSALSASTGDRSDIDNSPEAISACWAEAAEILVTSFSQFERAADTYCKAAHVLGAAAATPGGIVAFMDYITFPEASSTTIDLDLADKAYDLFRRAAAAAQRWERVLMDAKKDIIPALAKQIDALFEAGLCGLCGSNGLAQRAFEAASTVRDKYERQESISSGKGGADGNPCALSERGTFLLNMGDLSFHLGHSYVRAGKLQYAIEEAGSALRFYGNPEVDKGIRVLRQRMTLGLRALAHTMRGAAKEAEDDLKELESGFLGPMEDGCKELANVRTMIARRARRSGLDDNSIYNGSTSSESGGERKKPVPVVASTKPPTALQRSLRNGYRDVARGLDRFLSFMTGDHWTSVAAAWLLILLSLVSVVFLAGGLWYQAKYQTQDL